MISYLIRLLSVDRHIMINGENQSKKFSMRLSDLGNHNIFAVDLFKSDRLYIAGFGQKIIIDR